MNGCLDIKNILCCNEKSNKTWEKDVWMKRRCCDKKKKWKPRKQEKHVSINEGKKEGVGRDEKMIFGRKNVFKMTKKWMLYKEMITNCLDIKEICGKKRSNTRKCTIICNANTAMTLKHKQIQKLWQTLTWVL